MMRTLLATVALMTGCDLVGEVEAGQASKGPRTEPQEVRAEPDAASVPQQTRERVDRIAGNHRIVDRSGAQARVEAAVEKVVSEMNLLVRPIARTKLLESNKVPRNLRIEREGDAVVIAFDGREYRASLDGSPSKVVGVTGKKLTYRVDVAGTTLKQDFEGDGGGRINRISKKGDTVTVAVKVHSQKLPAAVEYTLRFKST